MVHLLEVGELCPKIIPACAVIKIREQFPEENGIYRNFGDYNKEECVSEIAKAWEYIGDVEEELFLYSHEDIHILYSVV